MNPNVEKLRDKYIANPPEGMSSMDIRNMSEDNLLDMDYFLNEDDEFKSSPNGELSYKVKKRTCMFTCSLSYSLIIILCSVIGSGISAISTGTALCI